MAEWLEERGFDTFLEERRFGPWITRQADEPTSLCAASTMRLHGRRSKSRASILSSRPGSVPVRRRFAASRFTRFRHPERRKNLWSRLVAEADENFEDRPAYEALKREGMDECGLTQLASRTVGVPFVGLIAAALAIAELLRRLHGGTAIEIASASAATLDDIEAVAMAATPFPGSYVEARSRLKGRG